MLNPAVKVPTPRTVCRRVEDIYEKQKTEVAKSTLGVGHFALAADLWNTRSKSFLGITVHFVSE